MALNYFGLNSVDSITITGSTIHAAWDEEKPGDTPGGISCKSPLDHGAAGIGSGLFGSMGNITIHDSTVYAKGFGSGAGIGGGGAGSNSKIFGLDKLDIGDVGTIEIRNSTVEAHSGCAYFTEGTPITVDTGYIIYTIEPASMGSGAGIGGGSGAGVQKIDIQNCPKVQAYSHSGAGIGGGRGSNMLVGGWVDHIYLINCDEVTAKGGKLCAGIGTGGGDGLRGPRSSALKEIYIKDCGKVTATGGESAAGIGCGIASPYEDADTLGEKTITIIDSNVTATGGKGGAGIGGGVEQAKTGYGGENPPILIKGNCRIDAKGGDCNYYEDYACDGGGAGIGGGSNGGATTIEIELTEDETTPRGYMGFPGDSNYYVHAEGGEGAAGIGGGGSAWTEGGLSKGSNDSDSIYIKSGAVFARGGATHFAAKTRDHDNGLHLGAGAGIGGGSAEGTVSLVKITGGYIQAEGGRYTNGSDKADDIGTGGDWSTESEGNRDASGTLVIEDGTVFANRVISFGGTKRISGGSVSAKIDGAINDSGSSVYQTTAKLENAGAKQVSLQTMRGYGANHLYTNGEGQLYLYLERRGSAEDKSQWADINVADDVRHYIGYTLEDHSGLLKMDGKEVPFNDPGIVRYGSDFELSLQDAKGYSGAQWTFVVEGAASSNDTGTVTTSPGAKLSLHAGALGAFTVRGTSPYTPNADYYWGTKASFSGQVQGMDPQAAFTEDPAKIYDGTPVVNPSVTSASGGAVSYVYQDSQGLQLEGAPKDVGTYTVTATVAATGAYGEGVCSKQFKITPADTTTVLSFEVDGSAVTMTARVLGLHEADGFVHFRVSGYGTYSYIPDRDIGVVALADGGFGAVYEAAQVSSATYSINASYNPSSLGNYRKSSEYESRTKNLADRVITGETYHKVTYGSEPFELNMGTDHPTQDNDDWFYEVEHDSWAQYGFDSAVSVDRKTGKVTVNHAGKTVIEVRLGNFREKLYNDTKTYVTIEVEPAPLTVTSYAYVAPDMSIPITSAHYGQLTSIHSAIKYDGLQNGDDPTTFTHGHGHLEVSDIPRELGAGEFTLSIERHAETVEPVTVNGTTYEHFFFARDYEITLVEGKLQVEKARLAVEADEAHGSYGGQEPRYGWKLSEVQDYHGCDGLAPWDSVDTILEAEPTVTLDVERAGGSYAELAVGRHRNVLVPQGGSATNYSLVYLPGDLVVDGVDLGDVTRFEVDVQDTTYNGVSQQQPVMVVDKDRDGANLVEGADYTLAYSSNTTDVGEVTVTVTGKGGYSGTRVASYAIRKARLTVTTQSASGPYDGTPLTAGGSVEGVMEPDGYTFRTTGSQTEPGWSYNSYELTFTDEQKGNNYLVNESLGRLTVHSIDVQGWSVTTPGNVTYDGAEHRASVTVRNELEELLSEGDDYSLSYDGDTTGAGTVTVTVTGIGGYSGTKEVSYRILPAPLLVRTDSASKEYDGTPLTADGKIEGLIAGETAAFEVTGTQTEIGASSNSYTLEWNGSAREANYAVSATIGTLTVTSRAEQLTITAPSASKPYDGKPLVANGSDTDYPIVVKGLPGGFVVRATASGSRTEVGSSANVIDSYQILNATGEDCTGVFANVTLVDGVLTVTQASRDISFLASPTKVYDAKQVDNPQVSYPGDGTLRYTYYNQAGERLEGAPTDAGSYEVEATVTETTNYAGATARMPFDITPAPTAVHLALSQQGSSGTATAIIDGLYDLEGTVTFLVNGVQKGEPVSPTKDDAGVIRASFVAYDVPEGSYKVQAQFNPACGNYQPSQASAAGDKSKTSRKIVGETQRTKTYGDDSFELGLRVEDGKGTVTDSWRYEVHDVYETLGFEPAVEVSEDGMVTIRHAGTAIIEVTLTDGESELYDDVSAFVAIHVSPKKLIVRSQAVVDGTQVSSATYGNLGALTYELTYEGLVSADQETKDVTHGHGRLLAVPIDPTSAARQEPYQIAIAREGTQVTIGGTPYENVFYARDYDIDCQPGSVKIEPADLSDGNRFTTSVTDVTYNGSVQEQPVRITDTAFGGAILSAGTDYELSYVGDKTNVGTVNVTAQGKGNYTGDCLCSYRITRAPLVACTPSASKVYDSNPLVAEGSLEGLVAGETATFMTTGTQTEVGSSTNTYSLTWDGTAKEGNYQLREELGVLTVKNPDTQIVVTTTGGSCVYDGKPHGATVSVSDLPAGYRLEAASSNAIATDVTQGDLVCTADTLIIKNAEGVDVTDTLNLLYINGTLSVTPATIVVTTPDATKAFDGAPLTAEGSMSGLVTGETALFTTTGTQTEIGSSTNTYSLTWEGTAKESNYQIEEHLGTLTITNSETPVTLTAPSAEKTYDGTPLMADGHVEVSGLPEGFTVNATASGSQTDVGVSVTTVDDDYVILGPDMTDQTANLSSSVTKVDGTLTVTPAPLVVRTPSASKTYDGEPLTAEGSLEGLVAGETVSFATTGAQTEVGSSTNTYSLIWDGTAQEDNYQLSEDLGTLNVTPKEGTNGIEARGWFDFYDGDEHAVEAQASLPGSQLLYSIDDGQTWSEQPPSVRDVTEGPLYVDIRATNDIYDKGNAQTTTLLQVVPAPLMVTTDSASKHYDGAPLTAEGTLEGIVHDETATFTVTGTQTEVGSSTNTYTLEWDGTAKESNYFQLLERLGTLTVTSEPHPGPGPNPNPDPDRVIDGEFSHRKTYGDEPFALGLASRNPRDTDVWTYEVDYDDYAARGFEPAVSVDDKGIVTIHHAGSSIIKVTLSDEQGTYEKVVSYVYVTINPASLAVSSFANRGEEQVTSAAYGSLGQLSYGLSFNGLVYDDTPDTFTHGHGTLQAVPVDETSDASVTPYAIDIAKLGVPLTVEGESYEDAFVSRDYLISYDKGSLMVTPAPLTVRTQSASKPYDGTPLTAEGSVEGLVNGQTVGFAVTGSQTAVGSSINTYMLAWNGTAKESNYQVTEDLGILSVTGESPTIYRYLGDGDQSWTKGSGGKLVFVYKRSVEDETTYEHFMGIKVDGVAVARDLYEAHSGSVVISLAPDYLKGLSLGNHVLTACFDDGVAPDVNFTITENGGGGTDSNGGGGTGGGGSTPAGGSTPSTPGARTPSAALPETGDVTDGVWMMVLALAGLGLVVLSRLVSRMQER